MGIYNDIDSYDSDLKAMVGNDENILWRGRPDKKCFILESIFNPMLPFALIWGILDLTVVGFAFGKGSGIELFILAFMAIHLMPVWIYIGGVLMSFRRYRNTAYLVTDKGVYISSGVFSKQFEMKPFTDLSHINIHRGIFDQFLGVGDVVTVCGHNGFNTANSHAHSHRGMSICDISDYQEVFKLLKDLQTDIYSDTMYPNEFRPENNPGYKTRYKGL